MAKNEDEVRKAKEAKQAKEAKEVKQWTLMFFFASDNNLSPSMLYQLKSIKGAGSQPDTNVVVHFDPHERGVPSMIFEINKPENEEADKARVSDYKDLIIRNLACDEVVTEHSQKKSKSSRKSSSKGYDSQEATDALTSFLEFCVREYPARQYMLFLVGHGLVVGRDAFLPDDNPDSSIGLAGLEKILKDFNKAILDKGVLELIGMHSCSMSAIEVAYQLKGQAKYMMASEGLSFVGAWPYRQMLLEIFDAVDEAKEVDVEELVKQLHELCVQNSADFIFAGYSSDLCLCSLNEDRVKHLTTPIQALTKSMMEGLKDPRGREIIQLAHLESQSYFQEAYTDLYDFCLCLSKSCNDPKSEVQKAMKSACRSVIRALTPGNDKGPIIQADFFGPDCQHSYGLSIYFPWIRPIEDASEHVIKNYKKYDFVSELEDVSWFDFLNTYFKKTLRGIRRFKYDPKAEYNQKTAMKSARSRFKAIGFRGGSYQYGSAMLTGKVNPSDAGGFWSPSSIKNYSREFSMSEGALKMFAQEKAQEKAEVDEPVPAAPRRIA